jgi:ParB-like chromosome segregation protein Spo0J
VIRGTVVSRRVRFEMKNNSIDKMSSLPCKCDVSEIKIPKGKVLDPVKVKELAESIKVIGLINAIVIDPNKKLIAGFHRLEAYKLLGLTKISATIKDISALNKELTQVDENLIRKHLDALTQGELLIKRKELLSKMGVLAKAGDNKHTIKPNTKTAKDLAETFGKSERTMQRLMKTVKGLAPEAVDNIRGTEIAKNETALSELSRQDKDIQIAVSIKIKEGKAFRIAMKESHQEKTRKKLENAAKEYSLPDSVQLHLGDFKVVTKKIPDNSIQLLLTDPLYNEEAIKDYRDVAEVAKRVLKPGGFLIVYCGTLWIDKIFEAIKSSGLIYHWIGGIYFTDGITKELSRNIISRYRPVLFFRKEGQSKHRGLIYDMFALPSEVELHHYQQNIEPIKSWIMSLTEPHDTVLDCFLGTGTVGAAAAMEKRKFIGIEIDNKMLATAKARIKKAASEETEEIELKKAS